MKKLQEVIRTLRRAGAVVNESCGMHVHVDASRPVSYTHLRRFATRYEKKALYFHAVVCLACILGWFL